MKVALMVALLAMQSTLGQPQAGKAEASRLFEGAVNLRGTRAAAVNVAIYSWVIREQQKIAALDVPLRGTAVVQLRAGSLTTVIEGRRQLRHTGDFFTVPAGVSWGLETEGDTAILEAVIVAE